ncbi:MAG: bifunctional glutamate N-acetyltransferase/amino-acid acetyltransferase ArgJ [Desulfobacterales bacterium]|jgi:glutamate N-acetyltransferase/amino-acid N-acetyltransferase
MKEILFVNGFQAAGVAAGLKKNGKKDLGLIFSTVPAAVAGVFTRNRIQAAPVVLDRKRIQTGKGRAIVVNSGNANCCTGEQGIQNALAMAKAVADGLDLPEEQVLVASTGVIGEQLPIQKIKTAVPALVGALNPAGLSELAEAIMTTDTVPKVVAVKKQLAGKSFHLAAVAKGAGMIRPDMATMLCFVISDIELPATVMQTMLKTAVDRSFNRITVDGDMSTNDTVLFMANGASGVAAETREARQVLQGVLDDALLQLARLCVKDGEGATKLVEVRVSGAASDPDARSVADTVANSSLVKTALFGQDANWGRILAAAGRAGVPIDPARVDIYFDKVMMVKDGLGRGKAVEAQATAVLKKPEFVITIDLKMASGCASVLTCDLSIDYVKINADYRS